MGLLTPEFIENFHFLRPLLLWALAPALLLFLVLHYLQSNQSNWSRSIDPALLPYLLDRSMGARQSWPLYGLLLLWSLGVVALAGPVWQQIPVPVQEREDAVVIVADLSLSMYAEDLRPNRATRLQRKILDILEERRLEGQTALVVYAGSAHTVTPMTDDVATIRNLVPSLQPNIMPQPGSDPAKGIALAVELFGNSNLSQGRILLLTDGILDRDVGAIGQLLAGTGHTLSVIGFGTEAGAPIPNGQQGYLRDAANAIVIPRLERAPLQELARRSGGYYADAQLSADDVQLALQRDLLAEGESLREVDDRQFDSWYETGPWLLLLALPLAALAFRRGWILMLVVGVGLGGSQPGYAWEWRDLWERKDQQGAAAFAEDDFDSAAQQFRDPNWRAAANYRQGAYEQVLQDLALIDEPEAHYNRGNALAQLGMFAEAIAAYERTLAQLPDHLDAQHNKALVEALLEQEEQQNQQNQGQDPQQQEQQEQQQQQQDQQQQDQQQQDQQQQDQQQDQQQQDQQQQDQQQQQEQQDREQQNQDREEQQNEQEQESEEPPEQQQEQQNRENREPETEEEQAMQQWLMRIPDDPGELLRNKFRYQTQQRVFEELQNPGPPGTQDNRPIW